MNFRNLRITAGTVVLGIFLCVPFASNAQISTPPQDSHGVAVPKSSTQPPMRDRMTRRARPRRQLKRLTRMLHLTPDQQHKMLPILQQRNQQMRAIHNNASLNPQERRQQMRQLMMTTRGKLEAVMTDSQKQQFEQKMQQRRQRMQQRRGMQPGNGQNQPATNGGGQGSPQQ